MASIAKDALAASLQDLYHSKDDDPLADFKVVTEGGDEIKVHSLLMVCRYIHVGGKDKFFFKTNIKYFLGLSFLRSCLGPISGRRERRW